MGYVAEEAQSGHRLGEGDNEVYLLPTLWLHAPRLLTYVMLK